MNDENNLPFKGPTIDLNEVSAKVLSAAICWEF